MIQGYIILLTIILCMVVAATGYSKLIDKQDEHNRMLKSDIRAEIDYDIDKALTDYKEKFCGFADIIDKDIAEQNKEPQPYLVVKQWYDNLHCTKEIWNAKSAMAAYECAADENIDRTYTIINVVELK